MYGLCVVLILAKKDDHSNTKYAVSLREKLMKGGLNGHFPVVMQIKLT